MHVSSERQNNYSRERKSMYFSEGKAKSPVRVRIKSPVKEDSPALGETGTETGKERPQVCHHQDKTKRSK